MVYNHQVAIMIETQPEDKEENWIENSIIIGKELKRGVFFFFSLRKAELFTEKWLDRGGGQDKAIFFLDCLPPLGPNVKIL